MNFWRVWRGDLEHRYRAMTHDINISVRGLDFVKQTERSPVVQQEWKDRGKPKGRSVPKISSLHTSLVTMSVVCVSQFYRLFFYFRHSLKKTIYFSSLFCFFFCLLIELKSTGTAHHFSFLLNSTDYRILRMDEDHDRMYVGSKDYILSLDLHDINKEPLIVRNAPHQQ